MQPNYLAFAQMINQSGNFEPTLASLGKSIDDRSLQQDRRALLDRQNRLSDLQYESGQMDLEAKQTAASNLRDLVALQTAQQTRTVPQSITYTNPAYASDQAGRVGPPQVTTDPLMNELTGGTPGQPGLEYPGQGVPEEPKTLTKESTRGMTPIEKATELQDFLKSRGMFDQLATIGKTEDITAKMSKDAMAEISTLMGVGRQAAAMGKDPKEAIRIVGQYIGKDTSLLETMQFSPDGQGAVTTLPDGSKLIKYWDGEKDKVHYAPADKSEEKFEQQLKLQANMIDAADRRAERQTAAADRRAERSGKTGLGKPMPPTALKMQQESVEAIGLASSLNADLGVIKKQITTGELDLGPFANFYNRGRNLAGFSSEQSRNLQTLDATLEKLRNDSLRLNKGVQTEGDAVRAWNELMKNLNDPKAVSQRIAEIENINARAVELQQANIDNIRENYGKAPLETSRQRNVEPALGKGSNQQSKTTPDKRPPLSAIFGKQK